MIDKLHAAAQGKTVVVAGLGGLGGYVAAQLGRYNFARLILIDKDEFEPSNMDRQLFCNAYTIGKNKAKTAAQELKKISNAIILAIEDNLTLASGHLIKDADLLLDCTDSVESKLELQKVAAYYGIPLVHAAISCFYGQCSVVFPGDDTLSKIYANQEEHTLPTLSFVPAILAGIQVAEGLKTLAGMPTLRHKLLVLDILNNDFRILNI